MNVWVTVSNQIILRLSLVDRLIYLVLNPCHTDQPDSFISVLQPETLFLSVIENFVSAMFPAVYPDPCGCWFIVSDPSYPQVTRKQYLPQVDLIVRSTILSVTSRTTLTQAFINPSPEDLQEV